MIHLDNKTELSIKLSLDCIKMVYGCGNQLIKFFVFIANFFIFLFGGLIFGFSLWANLDQNFARHLTNLAKQANIDDNFIDDLAQVVFFRKLSKEMLNLFFSVGTWLGNHYPTFDRRYSRQFKKKFKKKFFDKRP